LQPREAQVDVARAPEQHVLDMAQTCRAGAEGSLHIARATGTDRVHLGACAEDRARLAQLLELLVLADDDLAP